MNRPGPTNPVTLMFDAVVENIVRFAQLLRGLGIPVGTSEVVDAVEGVALTELTDRQQVKGALAATLIKDGRHLHDFEKAFEAYFVPPEVRTRRVEAYQKALEARRRQLESADTELQFQGDSLQLDDAHKSTYAGLSEKQRRDLKEFLERSSTGKGVDGSFRPLIESIVKGHLDRWRRQLKGEDLPEGMPSTGDPELDHLLSTLRRDEPRAGEPIVHTDLKDIAEEDIPQVLSTIRRLSARLASKLSRRYRASSRKKRLDIRKTIRSNIRYGGSMLDLRFRSRQVNKPKVLLLCDVSGSMARYARFVLQFIYGLSSALTSIRSFVFSEHLEDVSGHFSSSSASAMAESVDRTLAGLINDSRVWGEGTDLGRSLEELISEFEQVITGDTIVVIVSDTKTLNPGKACRLLDRIGSSVAGVIWLNTLPQQEWEDYPTCELFAEYARMFECNTLADLERILQHELR